MSIERCLTDAADAGEITWERARAIMETYRGLYARYRQGMADHEAQRVAGEDVQAIVRAEATAAQRDALLLIAAQRQLTAHVAGGPGGSGGDGRGVGPPGGGGGGGRDVGPPRGPDDGPAHIDEVIAAAMNTVENLDGAGRIVSAVQHQRRVLGQAHRIMTDVLATHRRDLLGRTREPARLENLVRELHGTRTGDRAASELADAWRQGAEYLRQAFNAAGGRIPRLQDWALPQTHDVQAVREAGFETWRAFVLPRLDRNRMLDWRTGRPLTDADLEAGLRQAYDRIRTDGWIDREPSRAARGVAVANRHLEHRFLHFRSGDAWLEYNRRFGTGDAFTTMMGYTSQMAREIGAMRAFGPNPRASIRWLQDFMARHAAVHGDRSWTDQASGAAKQLEAAYDVYIGTVNDPGDGRYARAFMATRNFLTSSMLGSAAISAISDVNFQTLAARFSGLDSGAIMRRYRTLLDPTDDGDRRLAVRLGLIGEEWSRIAAAQARYVGEVQGPEWSQRLADFTLRVSGLSPWTQAGRWAFGMEFMGLLADSVGRGFDALDPALQSTMRRFGLGPAEWDRIRATGLYRHGGAGFLRPDDVAARADLGDDAENLATRLMAMIQTETEYAVPSASVRARAAITGPTRPGTVAGEVIRSGLMFKNFGLTLFQTHIRRAMGEARAGRVGYTAHLIVGSTMMGALAMTMKDVAKGRDPRDMAAHPAAFWGAALLQGGGLGIFGDFLFQDQNRFGGGIASTVAGPVAGAIEDVLKLTVGNVQQAATGEDTDIGRDLVRFASRYAGPASSVWYSRLVTERLIFDTLQRMVDPKFDKRVRRLERTLEREQGSGFWWRPGDALPGDHDRGRIGRESYSQWRERLAR